MFAASITFQLILFEGYDFLTHGLSRDQFEWFREIFIQLVLSTDSQNLFDDLALFRDTIMNPDFDVTSEEDRLIC